MRLLRPRAECMTPNKTPDSEPVVERHVFVYGTLRQGGDNDITRLRPAPRYVGAAMVAGTMYDLGRYPGVILGGESQVVGEVWRIDAELERVLDEIEELYPQQSDEYAKRLVAVSVDGQTLQCVVYEINPLYVSGKNVVRGGDWSVGRWA